MRSVTYYAKAAVKAVTTQEMRESLKRWQYRGYAALGLAGRRRRDEGLPFGVNLVGHARGDFGLGESCRLVAGALTAAGVPLSVRNVYLNGPAAETNTEYAALESEDLPYGVDLIHINPNKLSAAVWSLDPKKLRTRRNIAYWLWELPEFPPEWMYAFDLFDEIWTPSRFISGTLQRYTGKPVYTMPYGLRPPKTAADCGRARFGLPEDVFLFLLSYDGNSVSARKNPEGAIRAFRQAFSPADQGVGLVIKATHENAEGLRQIREQLRGYPNIFVLTESYPKEVFNSLVACADAYVSLHRAEGFGLVMAEAMLLGTPVIATAWSANTEFMDGATACMVDAKVVELERDCPPYHAGDHWAQPDEAQAAAHMRRLYEDAAFRTGLAAAAKARLTAELSPQKAGQTMKQRLLELR